MENPATWRPLEHAINQAITNHYHLKGFDHSGKTLEQRIAVHLYHVGLAKQHDAIEAEHVIRHALRHGLSSTDEEPVCGLSIERRIADELRNAELVQEEASELTRIDRGEIKPKPEPPPSGHNSPARTIS